ncbi:protoglobin domain-containing protein [Desulfatiglans anilini]|uniref:protoglobin domain-containing protein n=1 Tax=Desulfatiglans anilini TaxID=90728 RepID=UPI000420E577|nr:protoglobin domain-containing protein [Desulfatiglans anilini]
MENMQDIRKHYRFSTLDDKNLAELAGILLPYGDQLAEDFYTFLLETPQTAAYFTTDAAVAKRKYTIKSWFRDLLTADYDHRYLLRLQRIGKIHVKIGLNGHYVNAAMNFIRTFCISHLVAEVQDTSRRQDLVETMNKVLDISLDVMTSSYREAELKKVFISHRAELWLVRWAERLLHGLNLVLMVGLVLMSAGVAGLLVSDILYALRETLETGIIRALGSLLILWMMIELLHTQVEHLRGGGFRVQVFVELALVAFIRKLFVAAIDEKDAVTFALLIGGLLVLGIVFYLTAKIEPRSRS